MRGVGGGVKGHVRGRRNDGFQLKMRVKHKRIPYVFHVWNQPCGSENHVRHENTIQERDQIIFFFFSLVRLVF